MNKYKEAAIKRRQALVDKLGSEEAVSEYYRNLGKKSADHPNRAKGTAKGGFNYMDKERLKEVARLGGSSSRRGK